jgi:hydroxymethylpyrimidine/phosphomethylpyrimidine kinase
LLLFFHHLPVLNTGCAGFCPRIVATSLDNIQEFSGTVLSIDSDFEHFKISLADTAFRAFPASRNIFPARTRTDTFIRPTFFLVVYEPANRAHVFFHDEILKIELMQKRFSILVFAGHDPTGGAGIQADIETINDMGGHACSIITALTAQNSHNLQAFTPTDPMFIRQQFDLLAEDMKFDAIKIGMLAAPQIVRAVADCLASLPDLPVIFDPVLAAGGGGSTSSDELVSEIHDRLLKCCRVITPNLPEARRLSGMQHVDDCARALLEAGCGNVIITGTHDTSEQIVHRLYGKDGNLHSINTQRLAGEYHGSGCTFASALAACIAQGNPLENSLRLANAYTLDSLRHADRQGHGQLFPVRQQHRWPD